MRRASRQFNEEWESRTKVDSVSALFKAELPFRMERQWELMASLLRYSSRFRGEPRKRSGRPSNLDTWVKTRRKLRVG